MLQKAELSCEADSESWPLGSQKAADHPISYFSITDGLTVIRPELRNLASSQLVVTEFSLSSRGPF